MKSVLLENPAAIPSGLLNAPDILYYPDV